MAKKKSTSKKDIENDFRKLFDHINDQKFESMEELESFMSQVVGKTVDDFIPKKKGKISKKEQSRELIYQAYDSEDIEVGRKLAEEALALDPRNAEAYNYLGSTTEDIDEALKIYEKGLEVGKAEIGAKNFKEMKGHFWGFHETRPYMKLKESYADCLYHAERVNDSIKQYAEMIELNPNDNQGIRYQYASILILHNKFKEYEKLRKLYDDEASALWLYNYAIYLFKKEGKTPKAEKALLEAYEANQHVIPFLIGENELPEYVPEFYGWGDENEALIYLSEGADLWINTEGAMMWAFQFYKKRKKMN